jgi:hypothetical protein
MKRVNQTNLDESFAFEVELGLRPDYSALEKKLIAENAELKQEIELLIEKSEAKNLRETDCIEKFRSSLHRELERLIDESALSAAKKEHLMKKVSALSQSKLEASVFDIFSYLEIK